MYDNSKDLVRIPLRNGRFLCASINDWSDEFPVELCVFIEESNGGIIQDIAVIRENKERDNIEMLAYLDKDSEDYTDKFEIEHYNEEDE